MKKSWYCYGMALALAFSACSVDKDDDGDEVTPGGRLKVLEYCPAPGQFINEHGEFKTMAEANAWAEGRLENKLFVSLGSFGGYITVKLPKVVKNRKGYDFGIAGNPFDGSSEPGIVWVSEDVNGNGIADDPWYELKGSDQPERDYEVTYFRPSQPGNVHWKDNKGNEGDILYLPDFHDQMYYPAWITADSYTLKGSMLQARTVNEGGTWKNQSFGWGYADNMGSDIEKSANGVYRYNQFELDNALDAQGNPAVLEQIHFVKVQSAILKNVDVIGEVSTEVVSFKIF